MKTIQIHPLDNVAVVLSEQSACQAVPRGHKIALRDIPEGSPITKYGCTIGYAKSAISAGDWVHTTTFGVGCRNLRNIISNPSTPMFSRGYLRDPSGAIAEPTVGPPSATNFGSSPWWAVSTPRPSNWFCRISTWSAVRWRACSPSPIPSVVPRWATTMPTPGRS